MESDDPATREAARRLYRYLQKHVKTTAPPGKHDAGEVITDAEIEQVIQHGCRSDLERAFLKVLHETGCRIGELFTLSLKDVQQREPFWVLRVDGKTGERPVFIRYSIPYLLRWLESYLGTTDPSSLLWVSLNNRFYSQPLRYSGAQCLIDRCFNNAGLTKKHNPHWFRHSRASLDAPHFSESVRNHKMGWVEGSGVSRRYTHMSGQAVEEVMKQKLGLQQAKPEPEQPQPSNCRICTQLNPATARFCWKCGAGLSMEAVARQQEYLQRAFELLPQILSDPTLKKRYEDKLAASKTRQ